MLDFPIVDSHVHLLNPERFGYAWTKGAPSLNRLVLPADLTAAAAPVKIDQFVFVEVDVDYPQHLDEAAGWPSSPRPIRASRAWSPRYRSRRAPHRWRGRGARRQPGRARHPPPDPDQPDPDFCIRPDFVAGVSSSPGTISSSTSASFTISWPTRSSSSAYAGGPLRPRPYRQAGDQGRADDPWRQQMKELAACQNVVCKIWASPPRPTTRTGRARAPPVYRPRHRCFRLRPQPLWRRLACPRARRHLSRLVDIVDWSPPTRAPDERRKLFRDNTIRVYRLD